MFRLALSALELDHHVAAQPQVIKQEVDDVQQHLPADEGEAGAESSRKSVTWRTSACSISRSCAA